MRGQGDPDPLMLNHRLLARYVGRYSKKRTISNNEENQTKPNKTKQNTQAANKDQTPRTTDKNVARTPEY